MTIIVGLGNPEPKYKNTRHNVGFMVIDKLAENLNADVFKFEKKFNAEIAQTNYDNKKIILIKPQTFMNNSGQAVRAVMDFYKILPKKLGIIKTKNSDLSNKLIVIHDDVDFYLENFKIQKNRSAGGHNGISSIIQYLKTQNFTRVRVGINSDRNKNMPTEKFVLEKFSQNEMDRLDKKIPEIIKKIL